MRMDIPKEARRRVGGRDAVRRVSAVGVLLALAMASVAASSFSWPRSSRHLVEPLSQPTLESKLASLWPGPEAGYSFAVFGDQRALAEGEWQSMIASIDSLSHRDPRLLFMLDTGDIVASGSYSDQFRALAAILARARSLPYLVGVGNHELDNNQSGRARSNTAAFLRPLDPSLAPDRLYYKKTIGRARFLFLDSNDLVYETGPDVPARRDAQLSWLAAELRAAPDVPGRPTVVVMHHPFLQSSEKHRHQARDFWSLEFGGRTFPNMLADGGVDLVLVGHTHTYERFRATRKDGKGFHLVNLSGRPRSSFLWFGDGPRRAREIPEGAEIAWFLSRGWRDIEGWELTQEEAMVKDETDQYALFRVEPDGGLTMSIRFMDQPALGPPVRLLWGEDAPPTPSAAPEPKR